MPVDEQVVMSRLERMRQHVKFLKKITQVPLEEFLADARNHLSAQHATQLAIECAIDIGSHIVSALDLGPVETYAKIFETLALNKIITRPLSEKMCRMTAFRNILVHEYLAVDLKLVFENIEKGTGDFTAFEKAIIAFLEKKA